ncbi:interferon alpha-inducible protein 27-like protein 2 isoform X2 [Lepisosteus oculatus]
MVTLAPLALGAAGFTAGGIAAGSIAAKMMSVSAVLSGGGVASGSLVAVLQSAGAAGLSSTATAVIGGIGSVSGYALTKLFGR